MAIIKNRFFFLFISSLLVLASLYTIITRDFNLSIEFTGGSKMEVSYAERPIIDDINTAVSEAGFPEALVQPFGDTGVVVRTRDLTDTERQELRNALAALVGVDMAGDSSDVVVGQDSDEEVITEDSEQEVAEEAETTVVESDVFVEESFTTIGPSVSNELRNKAYIALAAVAFAIVLFIAFAFRKVSKPVSSWRYGIIAVIALLHDVIIPIGVFVFLGNEIGTLFVVGLLSILGLSVNDTIVVFDRVRENLANNMKEKDRMPFDQIVGKSLKQTITRSINTSLTLIVVLLALFFVGPTATQDLALVLLIGTVLGTYSSIFVASPLLVVMNQKKGNTE